MAVDGIGVTPQEVAISATVNWAGVVHPLGFADEAGGQFPECAADGAWVPPELVATGPIPAALDRT
jgi:hypothetical protein